MGIKVPGGIIASIGAGLALSAAGVLSATGGGGGGTGFPTPDGTVSAPAWSMTSDLTSGIYRAGANDYRFSISGVDQFRITGAGIAAASGSTIGFGGSGVGAADVLLARDQAATLGLRNGTNAQTFRVYNTFTNAANGEYLTAGWATNTAFIATQQVGTGAARALNVGTSGAAALSFMTANVTRWQVSVGTFTGSLVPVADATYIFGSPTNRVSTIYGAGGLSLSVVTKTAAYTATVNDRFIDCDTSAAAYGITLPGTPQAGMMLTFTKVDTSANTLTVIGTIDGVVNPVITAPTQSLSIYYSSVGSWRFFAASTPAFNGVIGLAADGTVGAPAYSFASLNNSGMYNFGSGVIGFSTGGLFGARLSNGALVLPANASIGWAADASGVTQDTSMVRDSAANTIAMHNGTAAQTFRVYGTFTNTTNYERGAAFTDSSGFHIRTESLGTGVARPLLLGSNSTDWWQIQTSGNLVPGTDAARSVGVALNRISNFFQLGIHCNASTAQIVPNSGDTVTIAQQTALQLLLVAAPIADLTLVFPVPIADGHTFSVSSEHVVSAYTMTPTAPATAVNLLANTQMMKFRYFAANTAWYQLA